MTRSAEARGRPHDNATAGGAAASGEHPDPAADASPAGAPADDDLPAWAEAFTPAALERLARRRHLREIDRDWAFGGSTGRGMTVAIIDSGLETDHPALMGRVIESVVVEIDDEGQPTIVADDAGDLYGHGTACGGIILGVAPEVELVSIRVLGANLRGSGVAFLGALDWAIERGLEVVNLSLSSRKEALLTHFHEVVDEAYFQGMKLVGAANNARVLSYPTLFSSVFSVAAHAEPEAWRWYYNPHPPVEFGAWGVDVPVAWLGGTRMVATGNSFAAPHIAGLLALLCSRHPGLSPFEAKAILAATADNPPLPSSD
jgi:subtilisin family serine protease